MDRRELLTAAAMFPGAAWLSGCICAGTGSTPAPAGPHAPLDPFVDNERWWRSLPCWRATPEKALRASNHHEHPRQRCGAASGRAFGYLGYHDAGSERERAAAFRHWFHRQHEQHAHASAAHAARRAHVHRPAAGH